MNMNPSADLGSVGGLLYLSDCSRNMHLQKLSVAAAQKQMLSSGLSLNAKLTSCGRRFLFQKQHCGLNRWKKLLAMLVLLFLRVDVHGGTSAELRSAQKASSLISPTSSLTPVLLRPQLYFFLSLFSSEL